LLRAETSFSSRRWNPQERIPAAKPPPDGGYTPEAACFAAENAAFSQSGLLRAELTGVSCGQE